LIKTLADVTEVHPVELVTVKVYEAPAVNPVKVVVTPVPVIAPGLIVHVPVAGNPFNTTLPVVKTQVG
jgi:hypothetical protein